MKRLLFLTLTVSLVIGNASRAAQWTLGLHTFTLSDGFTIEVAAPSSLVPRPIEADFDEQGRLYVTDSSGSNDKVAKQLADKPHRVLRLEDTDGDGVFDKSVVFADKMMFPEGAMWHDGSLYVSAPPSIWKLTDTNSDGVADERVEWFKGKSLGGCANDLHGPYLGPDGWIYWCKGGFERQTNILGNGKTFVSRASHIWRARPDGTGFEPIMTGGMDNPVGLAWSAEGELFLSGTFFQHPGGGKRDGLIHVLYGGVYGKENDVLDDHPRTGDLLPIMTHLGPAAPCGMARYESAVFGPEYQNNLFVCNFNLHKISRHILKESGSTYATSDSDFLVSDNTDFHPTDVFEDADGSLLVIDTGGWYKLCCPTSQLPKPDVLGAVYRIRRKDAPKVNDPRGLKLAWDKMKPEELVRLFEDDRPAIVRRSISDLGNRTKRDPSTGLDVQAAISPYLNDQNSVRGRCNAIKALTQLVGVPRSDGVNLFLFDKDDRVRQTAFNSGGTSSKAFALIRSNLENGPPMLRRAGAESIGKFRLPAVQYLLRAAAAADDRTLEHAVIYALIQLGKPDETLAGLTGPQPRIQRAALIALDQMPGGNLKPEQVTPLLASTNALLKQTVNWVISHHPEWAGALAGFLKERMAVPNLSDVERAELQQQLAQFAKDAAIQELLAITVDDAAAPESTRIVALRAMSAARVKETPATWSKALVAALEAQDASLTPHIVAVVRSLPRLKGAEEGLKAALTKVIEKGNLSEAVRLEAAAAMPGGFEKATGAIHTLVWQNLEPDKPFAARRAAAEVFVKARFSPKLMSAFAEATERYSPLDINRILPGFANSDHDGVGQRLIASLGKSKALRAVRPEVLRACLTNYSAEVNARGEALIASLNADAAKQKARLDEVSLNLKGGDVRSGQAIFNGQKAACATCHAIGYLGGNLGPDLTKIGTIRTERDLLESIVFPSASFVRSYEPMLVITKSGDEHSGVLRKDAPDEVVLATGPNAEVRVARADITEMRPGAVSVMPQGLDEQLTREELADLLAFLKATRW